MPESDEGALIRCGPLVRYVDRTSAVLWVELSSYLELTAELRSFDNSGSGSLQFRAFPVRVGDSYYAWISCRYLVPSTWYAFRLSGRAQDGRQVELWPDRGLPLPSVFQTLPSTSLDRLRIAFGSCRGGYPPTDPRAIREGADALEAFANGMVADWEHRASRWPHLFLFTGDQIYSDELSDRLAARFRVQSSRLVPRAENPTATDFDQYSEIYREAWTSSPNIRWLLSCVPSWMIFDDHDVIDDWNISAEWARERHRSRSWVRLLTSALLSYWIYQGAGNLSPRQWRGDRRMTPLVPVYGNPHLDLLPRMMLLFERYTLRRDRASWGFTLPTKGTGIVVADTRMSRKLEPKRLITDNQAWGEFVARAKSSRTRRIVLVAPGPVLSPHMLHILLSRAAESIEGDPPNIIGGIAGGLLGALVAGPAGAVVGALAGSVAGEFLLDYYQQDLLEFADAELWPAFPTSLNRMLTLLEHLTDGVGTRRKRFIAIIAGDVHHSHILRGDLAKTRHPGWVWHFTMSPFRREVSQKSREFLYALDSGRLPYKADVLVPLEKPGFVDKQFARLDWYPIRPDGRREAYGNIDEWDFFGKFVGEVEFAPEGVTYTYRQVLEDAPLTLQEVTRQTIPLA